MLSEDSEGSCSFPEKNDSSAHFDFSWDFVFVSSPLPLMSPGALSFINLYFYLKEKRVWLWCWMRTVKDQIRTLSYS